VYRLALPPATANTGLHPDDYLLGGAPYLLVEEREAPGLRVEADDGRLRWRGSWRRVSQPAAGGAKRVTAEAGAAVTFAFQGDTVTWFTSRGPWAGIARLTLDGRPLAELDLYNPAPVPEAAYTFTALGAGPHVLTVSVTGARGPQALGSEVAVDAFVAEAAVPAPALPPAPRPTLAAPLVTPTPPPTPTPPGRPSPAPSPTASPRPTLPPTPTAGLPPAPSYTVQPGVPPVYVVPSEPTATPTRGAGRP
jgi:hypothetical protein